MPGLAPKGLLCAEADTRDVDARREKPDALGVLGAVPPWQGREAESGLTKLAQRVKNAVGEMTRRQVEWFRSDRVGSVRATDKAALDLRSRVGLGSLSPLRCVLYGAPLLAVGRHWSWHAAALLKLQRGRGRGHPAADVLA